MGRQKTVIDPELVKLALSKELWWSRLVFWGAAAGLGVLIVIFAQLCEFALQVFSDVRGQNPYLPFVICPVGFWLVWFAQRRFFSGAGGSGIPQVMVALSTRAPHVRDRLLSLRVMFGKIVCTILALAAGASVGREGPSVQVGAALFNSLGRYARFSRFERRKGLIIAGAAAGLAAAFNAPLAGIVFAIEEMKGSFEQKTSGLMLSAVILSGLVALALVGHYSHFGKISVGIQGVQGALAVATFAIIGGIGGGFFNKAVLGLGPRLRAWRPNRAYLIPLVCGFFVAAIGYSSKGLTFGTGHEETLYLLQSDDTYSMIFPLMKWLATLLSYLAGIVGGVFAPSLSVGAGIGALLHGLFEGLPREALLLLGMVSYLSAVVRAPVTAFVIVFEMTENHLLLFPLMAASFLSAGLSKLVHGKSLYSGLAEAYLEQPSQKPSP